MNDDVARDIRGVLRQINDSLEMIAISLQRLADSKSEEVGRKI